MRKICFLFKHFLWCLSFALLAAAMSCTAPEPKNVSFSGEWKTINENGISGDIEETVQKVITDGNRFNIETNFYINVYDGSFLYTKPKPALYADNQFGYEPDPSMFETAQREITPVQAKQMKFWLQSQGKKKGPGGNIAGQETILYEAAINRPDGQLSAQAWVDAEKNIVLKSIQTIYSKQIEQIVTKNTAECLQIDYYSLIDDTRFSKP